MVRVMTVLWRYLFVLAIAVCSAGAMAAPSSVLRCSGLPDPSAQDFEDPFRDLNPEQFDDLLFAVRLRARLQQDVGSTQERQKWQELLTETENSLVEDQIDIDWLLSQREVVRQRRQAADAAGNPAFEGQVVTLAGFAMPAPPDELGRPVAYLVPEPGMCSHLPPPPPNQMIRVLLTADWTPRYDHEPVRLTGRLSIAPTHFEMHIVDGLVPMHATFQMDAEMAEPLDDDPQSPENARSVADRLRAAAHRKTGATGP